MNRCDEGNFSTWPQATVGQNPAAQLGLKVEIRPRAADQSLCWRPQGAVHFSSANALKTNSLFRVSAEKQNNRPSFQRDSKSVSTNIIPPDLLSGVPYLGSATYSLDKEKCSGYCILLVIPLGELVKAPRWLNSWRQSPAMQWVTFGSRHFQRRWIRCGWSAGEINKTMSHLWWGRSDGQRSDN